MSVFFLRTFAKHIIKIFLISLSLRIGFSTQHFKYRIAKIFELPHALASQISLIKEQFSMRVVNQQLMEPMDLSKKYKMDEIWNAPKFIWSFAWKLQAKLLPILHYFDKCAPKDTFVNLSVLWWKAIAGNNIHSPTYDHGIAYDFLPFLTRFLVSYPLCLLYPKLHHQNVALRTVYLDDIVNQLISDMSLSQQEYNESCTTNSRRIKENIISSKSKLRIHLMTLGAGFDTRSIRFLLNYHQSSKNITCHEFDLKHVIEQKKSILQRFLKRRVNSKVMNYSLKLPHLYELDMNDPDSVSSALIQAFNNIKIDINDHIIFITEASVLYLNRSMVTPLLDSSIKTALQYVKRSNINYCFADRFPLPCCISHNITTYNLTQEFSEAVDFMKTLSTPLEIKMWQIKPGRARHMGFVSVI